MDKWAARLPGSAIYGRLQSGGNHRFRGKVNTIDGKKLDEA